VARLTGKTALVTGASRGIGRAIAQRLAGEGATVAVHYSRDQLAANGTVAAIEQAGGRAFAIRSEFGVAGDVDAVITALDSELPGQPLDILVNNAAGPTGGPIEDTTPEAFDRIFAINVKAPFFLIQQLLPRLRDGGRIVNISSVATRIANPSQTSYAMTKAAVESMSRTLANVLGDRRITVNTVASGATRHDGNTAVLGIPEVESSLVGMTALGRLGDPADIADVVAFLASDDGRWITGQVLDASGGLYLGPR
jgi:3-oxoacyl-[acyl-carrier protein] reductase